MRVLDAAACAAWADGRVALDARRHPARPHREPHALTCEFPSSFTRLLWLARFIEATLQPREACLIWVTAHGIFPSNENLHAFYRLRQSYGEVRLLEEAPGHLCLDHERAEVVTLVHVAMLFGWDVHLTPAAGYAHAFVSHDELVEFAFAHESQRQEVEKELRAAGLAVKENSAKQ